MFANRPWFMVNLIGSAIDQSENEFDQQMNVIKDI